MKRKLAGSTLKASTIATMLLSLVGSLLFFPSLLAVSAGSFDAVYLLLVGLIMIFAALYLALAGLWRKADRPSQPAGQQIVREIHEREIIREVEVRYCQHCGSKLIGTVGSCSNCGAAVH